MKTVKIISKFVHGGKQMQGETGSFDTAWLDSIKVQYEVVSDSKPENKTPGK